VWPSSIHFAAIILSLQLTSVSSHRRPHAEGLVLLQAVLVDLHIHFTLPLFPDFLYLCSMVFRIAFFYAPVAAFSTFVSCLVV
jgi:hypothetical protein